MNNHTEIFYSYAQLGALFNSGFYIDKYITDILGERTLVQSTFPFLPSNKEYLGWESTIAVYHLTEEQLKEKSIRLKKIANVHANQTFEILIPDSLERLTQFFHDTFGEPQTYYLGIMNCGGRSFWCFSEDTTKPSFGVKFGTYTAPEKDIFIRNRYLSEWGIEKSVMYSDELKYDNTLMNEDYGVWLEYNDRQDTKNSWQHSFLIRGWKNVESLESDDALIPAYTLLSKDFWSKTELLEKLGLPKFSNGKEIKSWFIDQLAPWYAKYLANSLFKTGLHLELHQQNIAALVRKGQIVAMGCQDLQDMCEDPITRFLLYYDSTPIEKLIRPRLYSGILGEFITSPPRMKPYASITGWNRQYLRSIGQYDRCMNVNFDGEEYLDYHFEHAVYGHLKKLAFEEFDIDIKINDSDPDRLFKGIALAQFNYQQRLLNKFVRNNNFSFVETSFDEACALVNIRMTYATFRSPWSLDTFKNCFHEGHTFLKYQLDENSVALLIKKNGTDQFHLYCNVAEPPKWRLDY